MIKRKLVLALLMAIATPALAQPLDRPTFVCADQQAAETAAALARLGDREALAIHSRSYGCVLIVPLDDIATGLWRDRERPRKH